MPNRLSQETSPYLRQHAENPVDWYPWGEEAFRRAREEDMPIHLSVGYAACHWCHVMAHESFENPAIARLMNERFVNIKVDRQERPDLDDIYQKVVQMKGQGGGWPLTVFMTPQGEPFFGGTYFPPEERYGRPGFAQVLLGLSESWKERRPELRSQVDQFLKGYRNLEEQLFSGEAPTGADMPAQAARAFATNTDPVHGGLGDAPKFPNPSCHDLVLRVHHRTREPQLLASVERTLDRMAAGGIYDHLGGGFARYSVDVRWAVPHFEKMLYDNGQLVKLYADAYRVTGKRSWRHVFEQSIAYVLRDLTHRDGGFYASELARLIPTHERRAMPWDAIPWRPRIHIGLFVHRVDGLVHGIYVLARDPDKIEILKGVMRSEFCWQRVPTCPIGLPLYLLQEADCRVLATTVSCGQDIAGDGAFSLAMIADYMDSLATYGAGFYRNLFWEAGMVGQLLYLEAEEAGIGATGIGCYFDDPVHAAFGIASREWQSFYHFTVGGPVEDRRITTLPAYNFDEEQWASQPLCRQPKQNPDISERMSRGPCP